MAIQLTEGSDGHIAETALPVYRAIQELCGDNAELREKIFDAIEAAEEIYSKAYGSGPSGLEINSGIALSNLNKLSMPDGRKVMGLMLSAKFAPLHVNDFKDPTIDAHVWVLEINSDGKIIAFSELPYREVLNGAAGIQ